MGEARSSPSLHVYSASPARSVYYRTYPGLRGDDDPGLRGSLHHQWGGGNGAAHETTPAQPTGEGIERVEVTVEASQVEYIAWRKCRRGLRTGGKMGIPEYFATTGSKCYDAARPRDEIHQPQRFIEHRPAGHAFGQGNLPHL